MRGRVLATLLFLRIVMRYHISGTHLYALKRACPLRLLEVVTPSQSDLRSDRERKHAKLRWPKLCRQIVLHQYCARWSHLRAGRWQEATQL